MSRLLIKMSKDTDFYVLWSTVVDGPLEWGTEAELRNRTNKFKLLFNKTVPEELAFRIADRSGSSTLQGELSWYGWDSLERLPFVWEDLADVAGGYVTREQFPEFIQTYIQVDNKEIPYTALNQYS